MNHQSMTGFGRKTLETENFTTTVEIKSVNNRFKDFRFKIPNQFSFLELEFKKELNEKFSRGSFDIYLNISKSHQKNRFDDLDSDKITQYLSRIIPLLKSQEIAIEVRPTDFLRPEFYKEENVDQEDELTNSILACFRGAILELAASRLQEGEKLVTVLFNHLALYKEHFQIIESHAQDFKKNVEEKLYKKVEDYKNTLMIDQGRLLQEVVFYLEKIDIHEEINRVHSHLEKLKSLLNKKDEVGRQLDFFIQELGRETNTIGSKSSQKEISEAVVQMKVQLEKMREQGLNLE